MGHKLTSGRPCELCGNFIQDRNKHGVCIRTPECKAEYDRRRRAADPEASRKISRDYRRRERIAAPDIVRERWLEYSHTLSGKASRLRGQAKGRAATQGLPFDLTLEWVKSELENAVTNGCPYLGIPVLLDADDTDHGPSIDQINPGAGYTQDNCIVVSRRANRIKNDAAPEELEQIARNLSRLVCRAEVAA